MFIEIDVICSSPKPSNSQKGKNITTRNASNHSNTSKENHEILIRKTNAGKQKHLDKKNVNNKQEIKNTWNTCAVES